MREAASDALLTAFEQHLSELALSRTTIINYLADVRAFASWFVTHGGGGQASTSKTPADGGACLEEAHALSLGNLTAEHIRAYRRHLHEVERRRVSTINRRLQALRKFCYFACQAGWLKNNPAAEVKLLPESKSSPPRTLSQREVTRLLDAARNSRTRLAARDRAILHLLLEAGLGVGELAALRLEDLEMGDDGGWVTVAGGSGAEPRRLFIGAAACRAMYEYLATRPTHLDSPYLFATRRGGSISTRTIQRVVSSCARSAGLPNVSAYTLRQTRAALWLAETGDLEEVARRLGHRRLETTARYRVLEACESEPEAARCDGRSYRG